MKLYLRILIRYLLVWGVAAAVLLLVTFLLPGFRFDTTQPHWWLTALTLPVEFALLMLLLRPLLVLATLPLNAATLGAPTLFFNGILLYLAAVLEPAFHIDNLPLAFVGLFLMTVINTSVISRLGIDEGYPFFSTILRRIGRRVGMKPRPGVARGLLILQVDGLSWRSLMRAHRRGRMPALSAMLGLRTHWLYRWQCGVPSNTPAVQSGLFYGSRRNQPGYRWYDRAERRERSASTAADLRECERVAAESGGVPLLAGGSCINSLLTGGAAKCLMTVSAMRDSERKRGEGEQADVSLFWLSPYAYTTAVLATAWDFLAGMFWQGWSRLRRRRLRGPRGVKPILQRAMATALLREAAFFFIEQDVVRGVPVIYSNFVGYDEVAHHAGPEASETLATLTAFDRKLQRLRRLIRRSSPIPYEIVILSDHGQSPCVPFERLYGATLEEMILELAGRGGPARPRPINDIAAVAVMLEALRGTPLPGASWLSMQSRATLDRLADERAAALAGEAEPAEISVRVSGSLAHVYCRASSRVLRLDEVRSLYSGLVEGLASHPGVGFVLARGDRGEPLVIGREGMRNLATGEVRGERDPLAPYGDVRIWTAELTRLAAGEDSGDLIVNGALLRRRSVVTFEDQVGTHGGLGGPQNDPFAILPTDWRTAREDLRSPEALYAHLRARGRQSAMDNAPGRA